MRWDILLPNLQEMKILLLEQFDVFMRNWWATFSVSFVGSILAIVIALIITIIALKIKFVDTMMMPIVALSQSFPLQAITPLIIILLGIGFMTKVLVAFLIAFFPIYGTCITALKTTPRNLLCFATIYQASFFKEIYYVRIPYALPAIISSMKIGFTLAVLGAVVAEFMQPDVGLGRMILLAQSQYQIETLYLCILLLIIQGLFFYISLSFLEKYFIKKGGFQND
jgi:NitT/TauT family transport system permease protein